MALKFVEKRLFLGKSLFNRAGNMYNTHSMDTHNREPNCVRQAMMSL